jgi:hypothetical protein
MIMNASLKAHPTREGRARWTWLPVIALLTLFVVASVFLPLRARSARSTPVKRAAAMRASVKSVAPPPAPVRLAGYFEDEFVLEGGSVRCGGSGCQPNILQCSTPGTFISVITGCCAQCCWEHNPDNCSSMTCCSQ